MDLLMSTLTFSINPVHVAPLDFNHLNLDVIMHQKGVMIADLRPVHELPTVEQSVQQLITTGATTVLDLGVTF